MTPSPSPSSAVRAAVDELQGLLENAVSPTPWRQDGEWVASNHGGTVTHVNRGEPDAALIAAAVTAVPHLLAAIKAVDELASDLESERDLHPGIGRLAAATRIRAALAAVDVTVTAE